MSRRKGGRWSRRSAVPCPFQGGAALIAALQSVAERQKHPDGFDEGRAVARRAGRQRERRATLRRGSPWVGVAVEEQAHHVRRAELCRLVEMGPLMVDQPNGADAELIHHIAGRLHVLRIYFSLNLEHNTQL